MTGGGGRRRRSALGWLLPLPRLPTGSLREASSGFRLLRAMGSLLLVRRSTCPDCGVAPLQRREDGAGLHVGASLVIGHPVLVCAAGCGYVRILDEEITSPEAFVRGQHLFRRAWSTFIVATCLVVAATALGLHLWSGVTLVGGVLVGVFVALQAAVLRYRAWQLSYRRLFEQRAPVAEWLAWEFGPDINKASLPGAEVAPQAGRRG